MYIKVGTVAGYDLIKDTEDGECYTLEDGVLVWYGQCPSVGGGGWNNTLPPINTPNISTGGVLIQSGGSWYQDLLNTILGLGAIGSGAGHIPSTAHQIQPQYNQPQLSPAAAYNQQQLLAAQQQSVGGNFGAGIENFVKQNFTLLAIAGAALVLYKSGRK